MKTSPRFLLFLGAFALVTPAFYKRSMLSVGLLCLLLLSTARGQTNYTITDLGSLGFASATGINYGGEIVGTSIGGHAILYSGGHVLDLGTLGGSGSSATGLNNRGQIIGSSLVSGDAATHAFLYTHGHMLDLATVGIASANAINNRGQIVGTSISGHAILYSDGQILDLNSLGVASANAINDRGQIAGGSFITNHAILYSGGQVLDLGTLGPPANGSGALYINNRGQVVGIFGPYPGPQSPLFASGGPAPPFVFLYNGGQMVEIAGGDSAPRGINNQGQVVGNGDVQAWLFSEGEGHFLISLLAPNSGWVAILRASGINDAGQIVGSGLHNGFGLNRPFLMTPVH